VGSANSLQSIKKEYILKQKQLITKNNNSLKMHFRSYGHQLRQFIRGIESDLQKRQHLDRALNLIKNFTTRNALNRFIFFKLTDTRKFIKKFNYNLVQKKEQRRLLAIKLKEKSYFSIDNSINSTFLLALICLTEFFSLTQKILRSVISLPTKVKTVGIFLKSYRAEKKRILWLALLKKTLFSAGYNRRRDGSKSSSPEGYDLNESIRMLREKNRQILASDILLANERFILKPWQVKRIATKIFIKKYTKVSKLLDTRVFFHATNWMVIRKKKQALYKKTAIALNNAWGILGNSRILKIKNRAVFLKKTTVGFKKTIKNTKKILNHSIHVLALDNNRFLNKRQKQLDVTKAPFKDAKYHPEVAFDKDGYPYTPGFNNESRRRGEKKSYLPKKICRALPKEHPESLIFLTLADNTKQSWWRRQWVWNFKNRGNYRVWRLPQYFWQETPEIPAYWVEFVKTITETEHLFTKKIVMHAYGHSSKAGATLTRLTRIFGHPFHLVNPSFLPITLSFGFFFVILTILKAMWSGVWYAKLIYCLSHLIFFGFFFAIIISWLLEVLAEEQSGAHTIEVQKGFQYGILLFILSEFMLFFSFFWAYFHFNLNSNSYLGGTFIPKGIVAFDFARIPLLNTFLLLASGLSLTIAHILMVQSDKVARVLTWLNIIERYKSTIWTSNKFDFGTTSITDKASVVTYKSSYRWSKRVNGGIRVFKVGTTNAYSRWFKFWKGVYKVRVNMRWWTKYVDNRNLQFRSIFSIDPNAFLRKTIRKSTHVRYLSRDARFAHENMVIRPKYLVMRKLKETRGTLWQPNLWLFSTIIFGFIFLIFQIYEYTSCMFSISDSTYGAVFFSLTGLHGLHVFIGVISLLFALFVNLVRGVGVRVRGGFFAKRNTPRRKMWKRVARMLVYRNWSAFFKTRGSLGDWNKSYRFNFWTHRIAFDGSAWYWHFVDVVWFFVFVFVYWWSFNV